jgi:hypothetical protein
MEKLRSKAEVAAWDWHQIVSSSRGRNVDCMIYRYLSDRLEEISEIENPAIWNQVLFQLSHEIPSPELRLFIPMLESSSLLNETSL